MGEGSPCAVGGPRGSPQAIPGQEDSVNSKTRDGSFLELGFFLFFCLFPEGNSYGWEGFEANDGIKATGFVCTKQFMVVFELQIRYWCQPA